MPYTQSDIYLASGCAKLLNTGWKDTVYKFDSSSFYNWEQDNLPVYDLEDRTDYLYESLGQLSGAGIGLIVSSFTPFDQSAGLRYVATLQEAIDALPRAIDCTVIIEVAISGALGKVTLDHFTFGPSGGIEIINRGFAKIFQTSSTTSDTDVLTQIISGGVDRGYITHFSSIDLANTINTNATLCTGHTIGTTTMWKGANRTFVLKPEFTYNSANRRTIGTSGISYNIQNTNSGFVDQIGTSQFIVSSLYGRDVNETLVWDAYDKAALGSGRVVGRRGDESSDSGPIIGLAYANYLSGVVIEHCDGPIYLRGFTVDANYASNSDGIIVKNSSDIVLENCSVARCEKHGASIKNSNVVLNRGFIAFGNFNDASGMGILETTPGLEVENSLVTLGVETAQSKGIPGDCPFVFAANNIGISLINSELRTDFCRRGKDKNDAVVTYPKDKFIIVTQAFSNTIGLNAVGSVLNIDGRLSLFENYYGIKAAKCNIALAEMSIDNNSLFGGHLTDTTIVYNKNSEPLALTTGNSGWRAQIVIEDSNQNLYMNNSTITYPDLPILNINSGVTLIFRNHGSVAGSTLPSIALDNGSLFRGVNVQGVTYGYMPSGGAAYTNTSGGIDFQVSSGVRGAIFNVDNGSTLELHGTQVARTNLVGPSVVAKQLKAAAIYANNGSKVSLAGPTTIAQIGVGVLADNNSIVELIPHTRFGMLDTLQFPQTNTLDQTDIELHTTRSGIVVNHNSHAIMKDVGDYHNFWGTTNLFAVSANYNLNDEMSLSGATASAAIKFYANTPGVSSQFNVSAEAYVFATNKITYGLGSVSSLNNATWGAATSEAQYLKYSRGGMCVRALNGSNVTVNNVNFKAGHGQVSAAILDEDVSERCGHIYAWAISPDSTLTAGFCSVSSIYPSGSFYVGPAALYASSCTSALSGAPSGTPDTGSLSVLDIFGLNANASYAVGYNPGLNKGPFRIFFTPNDPARYFGYAYNATGIGPTSSNTALTTPISVHYSEAYQLLAQGYNPPIDLSSTYVNDTILSALYPMEFSGMTGNKGKFFFVKDILDPAYENRILLDDSAMNTFANAKHCMVAKSNRLKLVSYVRNTTEPVGDGGSPIHGTGLRSLNSFDIDKDN